MLHYTIQIGSFTPEQKRWDDIVPTIHTLEDNKQAASNAQAIADAVGSTVRLTYIPYGVYPTRDLVGRLSGHYFQNHQVRVEVKEIEDNDFDPAGGRGLHSHE